MLQLGPQSRCDLSLAGLAHNVLQQCMHVLKLLGGLLTITVMRSNARVCLA